MSLTRIRYLNPKKGMTFVEIVLAVSLLGLISLALYKSLTNGLRVWEKSRELVIEEDVAIFFEKFAEDLRNTYVHSTQFFEGDGTRVSFPTFVWQKKMNARDNKDDYKEQMGQVEYFFDHGEDALKRKSANYSQARMGSFERARTLVTPIERIQFLYYYLTDEGEIFSEQVLETIPAGVEVAVTINDHKGTRELKRYFSIPLKI